MPGITNPAEAYFKDGIWGWDGSAWHKLPMVWGYSDVYGEFEYENGVAAGTHVLTFSTVGSGEVWVVTGISAACSTAGVDRIELRANVGGVGIRLRQQAYGVAHDTVDWSGVTILKDGDEMLVQFVDCALNDNLTASAWGYKMKIAE